MPRPTDPKLTATDKQRVLGWLAEFRRLPEIVTLCKEELGKVVTRQNISYYEHSARWKPIVASLREKFLGDLVSVPIAIRRPWPAARRFRGTTRSRLGLRSPTSTHARGPAWFEVPR